MLRVQWRSCLTPGSSSILKKLLLYQHQSGFQQSHSIVTQLCFLVSVLLLCVPTPVLSFTLVLVFRLICRDFWFALHVFIFYFFSFHIRLSFLLPTAASVPRVCVRQKFHHESITKSLIDVNDATGTYSKSASGRRRWSLFQSLSDFPECLLHVLLFALYRTLGPTVFLRSLLLSRFRSQNR